MNIDTRPDAQDDDSIIIDTTVPDGACIVDLTVKHPKIRELTPNVLERAILRSGEALEFKDLIGDFDTPVFRSVSAAAEFLERYLKLLEGLDNKKICLSRELPAILYKRRYMIATLMGMKPQTFRNYAKPAWKPGDLFNLHDQVFFLTVRLKSITRTKDGEFKYSFELP